MQHLVCAIFIFQTRSRACLKNHFRNLQAPLCGIFYPHSVAVARYAALIRIKSPTNWDSQLTKSLFQTRSRMCLGASSRSVFYFTGKQFPIKSKLVHRILICLATQNPESFRSSSEVLKRFRVFYFAVFSSQIVSRFFPSIQIQRYTRFICSSSSASRSVFTITWPIRSVPSAMAETSCPSG